MSDLQTIIETGYAQREQLRVDNIPETLQKAILQTLYLLDNGQLRVAEKKSGQWIVNQWVKQAILLSFKSHSNRVIDAGFTHFYDKLPLKFASYDEDAFQKSGIRVVPPACVRKGAYIAANTVLMPSYINIGAYVDSGTMIDTWASIGSCAQIGKNVHVSAGTGIGGVLEPLQANPTIIEDDCFIGARSEIAEGVIVEQGCGDFHGRVHHSKHADLQSRNPGNHLWPGAGRFGGDSRHTAFQRRPLWASLRGDYETGRRQNPWKSVIK